MVFWERFCELCKQKGITPTQMVKEVGIAAGSVTKWKNGSIPHGNTRKKIAEYFSVSERDLFEVPEQKEAPENGGIDYSNLSPEHIEFIRTVSELSVEELRNLKQIIDFVKSQRQ